MAAAARLRAEEIKLFNFRQLPADLFVRRSLFVVDFDKFPAYDPLRIDHERRWMRPATAVRIENTITVDHLVIFVFEQRKIEVSLESLAEHLAKFFRLRVRVHADREDLSFLLLLFC